MELAHAPEASGKRLFKQVRHRGALHRRQVQEHQPGQWSSCCIQRPGREVPSRCASRPAIALWSRC